MERAFNRGFGLAVALLLVWHLAAGAGTTSCLGELVLLVIAAVWEVSYWVTRYWWPRSYRTRNYWG